MSLQSKLWIIVTLNVIGLILCTTGMIEKIIAGNALLAGLLGIGVGANLLGGFSNAMKLDELNWNEAVKRSHEEYDRMVGNKGKGHQ